MGRCTKPNDRFYDEVVRAHDQALEFTLPAQVAAYEEKVADAERALVLAAGDGWGLIPTYNCLPPRAPR